MIKIFIFVFLFSACGKPIHERNQSRKEYETSQTNVSEKYNLSIKMFMNFNLLPLSGGIQDRKKFWSGNSWQLINKSINHRWFESEIKSSKSPNPNELKKYTLEQLKGLSPSEKYDLYMGRYDYPLKQEIERNLPPAPESWEGLCHGWAGASLNHAEPDPKNMINPDGIQIPFGSNDIKALLTYYYSLELVEEQHQLGKRCQRTSIIEDNCDEDVTPVELHAILANTLGLRGTSVIVDIERYKEVWNHPIVHYRSVIENDKRTPQSRTVEIRTTLHYVDLNKEGYWEKTNGTMSHVISQIQYRYELILDSKGNMIQGRWLSAHRPDFIWSIKRVEKFTGYLKDLGRLLVK